VKLLAAAFLVGVALSSAGASAQVPPSCCGEDFDPQWSSDGSQIAFIRRDSTGSSTLYAMKSDGGDERRLLSLGDDYSSWRQYPPLLSPDWTRIALIANDSALKIESVNGAETHETGTHVGSFAWSPDSRRVAFYETDTGGNTEIFVVESDGSRLRSLGPGQSPAWSPRGDQIAFVAPDGRLYVMQADGTGRRLVYDGNGAFSYVPSWSPVGDRIAFLAASRLVVVATDGTRLFDTFANVGVKAKWSPDGSLIAIEDPSVFSVVRVGTEDRWSFEDRRDPSWSPVANELTASFVGPCQRSGIYRVSLPSASRRLTLDCHIRGSGEADVLNGTPYRDIIAGLPGDDELSGSGGQDRLIGGLGDDTLLGGDGADLIEGGYGADLLTGGAFPQDIFTNVDDRLSGGPGPDDLRGGPGRDNLSGDTGNDVLRGGSDADVLSGGPGNDRIFASGDSPHDDIPDIVRCGAGRRDVAYLDREDKVSGCETVHRR
jgi:Tol biopolymer transport system component